MSGGKAYRHGYYATVPHTRQHVAEGSTDLEAMFVVIFAAMLIVLVAAVATDPTLSAAIGQIVGTAWSEAVALVMRVVGRSG